MFTPRPATRAAAVLGATAALTLAGTGAASAATTHASNVDGNTVSVTFTLDEDLLQGDACGAALTPTSAAAGLASQFAGLEGSPGIRPLLEALLDDDNVTVLRSEEGLGTPVVTLAAVGEAGKSSGTATAEDVPANVYALVSYCLSDDEPTVNAPLLVGDPVAAVTGSIGTASAGGGLDTASSLLEGGLGGEGAGEIGPGTLSSALDDGEGEQTPEA